MMFSIKWSIYYGSFLNDGKYGKSYPYAIKLKMDEFEWSPTYMFVPKF